jgi:dihydrolipoyl dehydrogenase
MVVGEVARPVEVLVVGGGPGGYTAAARAAELGREVVLVERDRLGGVCLNAGCIPSKALITAARDLERIAALGERGISASPTLDLRAVQAWKRSVVGGLAAGVRQLLAKVEVVQGTARLLDPHRVAVESAERVSHFRFDHAILATGSRPVELPELPVDGGRVLDSTGALDLEEVPATVAVVGGGYVGVELGTALAKLGAEVTVVEALDRILSGFDAELVREVERTLARLGVAVRTKATVRGLEADAIVVESPEGTERVAAARVVVAAGRRPSSDDLQLEEAGLATTASGHLEVDERRRTAVHSILAVGDLTPGPGLAHKAMEEGRVAAEAIAGLASGFDQHVPLIAFTDPELASVGMTEADAGRAGIPVAVGRARFSASGRAAILGERHGLVKLVADATGGVVLGVQLAGPGATDLVGEAALAVETACRAEDLARTIHPHPTLTEALGEAAAAAWRAAGAAARPAVIPASAAQGPAAKSKSRS